MNAQERAELELLERSMPESDPIDTWRDAFEHMDGVRRDLSFLVTAVGGAPLVAGAIFGFALLTSWLPSQSHIGIRIIVGAGGGGAGAAMLRAFFAAIPGFGWAKELERISNAVEPYRRRIDWLEAKDHFT